MQPDMEARSANPLPLDQNHARAALGRAERRDVSARPAAEDRYVRALVWDSHGLSNRDRDRSGDSPAPTDEQLT